MAPEIESGAASRYCVWAEPCATPAAASAHSATYFIDGMGKSLQPLTMLGDAVQVEYSAGETVRVMLEWM